VEFGPVIKHDREEAGLSQQQFLKELNRDKSVEISQSALSAWELGKRWPKPSDIERIAERLSGIFGKNNQRYHDAWALTPKSLDMTDLMFQNAKKILLHNNGFEKYVLWLIGHENLPFVNDDGALDHLSENISSGLHYKIIIFLDGGPLSLFRTALEKLLTLDLRLKGHSENGLGKVEVFLVDDNLSNENNHAYSSKLQMFEDECISGNDTYIDFYGIDSTDYLKPTRDLVGRFNSLAVYHPKPGKIAPPKVNLQSRNFRDSPNDGAQSVSSTVWYPDEYCEEIARILDYVLATKESAR